MIRDRRHFLFGGAAAAAGAVIAATHRSLYASEQNTMAIMIQFSGLTMHGRHKVKSTGSGTVTYEGWDAFLLESGSHIPELKIPIGNVKGTGHTEDRNLPGYYTWPIAASNVAIKLATASHREVATDTGKRKSGSKCPKPDQRAEFLDISWLADFEKILGSGFGTLKSQLSDPASIDRTKEPCLAVARVQLSAGTMTCARPSKKSYETLLLKFHDRGYEQFNTDIVRFTSIDDTGIQIEIQPYKGTHPTVIELERTSGHAIPILIQNIDESLQHLASTGQMTEEAFWHHHFKPYLELFEKLPSCSCNINPTLDCCEHSGASCDPPFYCVPGSGNLP